MIAPPLMQSKSPSRLQVGVSAGASANSMSVVSDLTSPAGNSCENVQGGMNDCAAAYAIKISKPTTGGRVCRRQREFNVGGVRSDLSRREFVRERTGRHE